MWRRREFHIFHWNPDSNSWKPFHAPTAPAAHPNHDPTSLWRSTHGWNQSGTCRIGWGLGDWGIGLMKNHTQDIPRISKMTISTTPGGSGGTFRLVVGPSQPPLDSIISGIIKPQTIRSPLLRQGLLHDGISLLLRHITMDGSHLGQSDHHPPGIQHIYIYPPWNAAKSSPTRGEGSPGCEVGISHLLGQPIHLWGVVNWARLGGLLIWYPAKVWFLDVFSRSGDVVIPQKHWKNQSAWLESSSRLWVWQIFGGSKLALPLRTVWCHKSRQISCWNVHNVHTNVASLLDLVLERLSKVKGSTFAKAFGHDFVHKC